MSTELASSETNEASRAACVERLRGLFAPGSLVWITDEQFEKNGPVWQVTMVLQGEGASWWKRRYRYDIPSDTLNFAGQTPIGDAELRAARANGRRL